MHKNLKTIFYVGSIFALLALNSLYLASIVAADGGLSLRLNRNVGIGMGNNIQGRFTAKGSGPSNVVNLTLMINGNEVEYVAGNELSFAFHTDDYPSGETNITLYGWDAEGTRYSEIKEINILGPVWSVIIGVGTGILVLGLLIAKYGKNSKRKKDTPSADAIKIDLL